MASSQILCFQVAPNRNGNCAYERFILMETDGELLMISRSNDGSLFNVNKCTRPNALKCVTNMYRHIV
jgi:hypothetical protein